MSGEHEGCRIDEQIGHFEANWKMGTDTEPAVLSGKLQRLKGGQKSTIHLRQVSPPGGVAVDYHRFQEKYTRTRGDSKLRRELSLVFPQIRSGSPVPAAVNATIRHWAHHHLQDPSGEPDVARTAPSLPQIEATLRAEIPDRSKPENMDIDWQEAMQVAHLFKVLHNRNDLLCLRMTTTQYLGGAHEMYSARHLIFDLKTGRALKADDLLIQGWKEPLTKMAAEDLRAQFGLQEDEPLTSPGPLDAELKLNGNLFISEEGLGFYFSPYEIAPFSLGAITPILPLQKVRHLNLSAPSDGKQFSIIDQNSLKKYNYLKIEDCS
jgi:hypothetical protein